MMLRPMDEIEVDTTGQVLRPGRPATKDRSLRVRVGLHSAFAARAASVGERVPSAGVQPVGTDGDEALSQGVDGQERLFGGDHAEKGRLVVFGKGYPGGVLLSLQADHGPTDIDRGAAAAGQAGSGLALAGHGYVQALQ